MSSNPPAENDQSTEGSAVLDGDAPGDMLPGQNALSFITRLAHETEAALGKVLDLIGQLQATNGPNMQVRERTRRLQSIFQSLAHLARLADDDQDSLDLEKVDATALTQRALDGAGLTADGGRSDLTIEAPPPALEVTTDPDALRKALSHLLAGMIALVRPAELTLRLKNEDSAAVFCVEHTGDEPPLNDPSLLVGSAGHAEDVEEVRAREGKAPETPDLDLSIAEAFSNHLGGDLEADSSFDDGGALVLRVPCDAAGVADSETSKGSGPRPANLLVVEDNDVTRRILRRMLEDAYRVDMAEEAEEAIQLAEERDYDAFVLDVNLSDRRTGVEVLQSVREMKGHTSTPAVACTAYALEDHREQFLRAGFDDVVTKPVVKRKILDTIDQQLNQPDSPKAEDSEASLSGIELPPIPTVLVKVANLASSSDPPDVEALVDTVRKDAVVSQWLIRHVNSAHYSIGASIDTVERAVQYLGFQPVCNLVLTKVIGESFSGTDAPEGEQIQQYIMRTGMLSAYISRELLAKINFEAPGMGYTGGIFAQIGRLALLEEEGEAYVDLWFKNRDRTSSFEGPPPTGQEILHLEKHYVQKGRAVGKSSGVSDQLQAVLRAHNHPSRVRERFQPLVPTVALGLRVAHHLHLDSPELEGAELKEGREALASDIQSFQTTRHVAEEVPLTKEELASVVADTVGEAQEFAQEAL